VIAVRGIYWSIALALSACSSETRFTALPDIPRGASYLFFTLADERVVELRAYEALPDPLLLELPEGTSFRMLVYDDPLDTLMALPGEDAIVALAPADASSDEAWALLPPRAWAELDGAAFVTRSGDLGPFLGRLRVSRPPCPPIPTARAIDGIGMDVGLSFARLWGDELLIGACPRDGTNIGGVYRLRLDQLQVTRIPSFDGTRGDTKGFIDGDVATLLWAEPAMGFYQMVTLARDSTILDRFTPTFGFPGFIHFDELEGARFGGALTAVAQIVQFDALEARRTAHLMSYDEGARLWSSVYQVPQGATDCPTDLGSQVLLDIEGPGRGVVGLLNGAIVPFDLSLPNAGADRTPIVPATSMCRSARTKLADGVELVTFDSSNSTGPQRTSLLWRRPGEPWSSLTSGVVVTGQAASSLGNLALIGAEGRVVLVYEHAPSHPELPPRKCYEVGVGVSAHTIFPVDQDTFFIGGYGLSGGVFFDLAR